LIKLILSFLSPLFVSPKLVFTAFIGLVLVFGAILMLVSVYLEIQEAKQQRRRFDQKDTLVNRAMTAFALLIILFVSLSLGVL
jgi:uncharacterized membrane protein YidH (DUF202 family)